MALVTPFCAIHYNPKQIRDLADVITPPYDVISPSEQEKYLKRSPYNFAHIILPQVKDDNYSRAASTLTKWREVDILHEDEIPSYYLYQQDFTVDGKSYSRRVLMCTVELRDFADGIIRPHENTHGKYKADRFQILKATQCNLSHIFGMVKDGEGFLESQYEVWRYQAPLMRAKTEDGVEHFVWKIEHSRAPEVGKFFEEKPIYIVDGHHRYESALAYARSVNALGNASHPASKMLFAISNTYDPALVVYPTHRLVHGLSAAEITQENVEKDYDLSSITFEALTKFMSHPPKTPSFGLYFWGELFLCTPKHWRSHEKDLGKAASKLAVTWSDNKFLKDLAGIEEGERSQKISYVKDAAKLWEQRSQSDLIIFHAPPAVEDITHVSDEKGYLPQKSTYFYPKLAAGLTLRDVSKA